MFSCRAGGPVLLLPIPMQHHPALCLGCFGGAAALAQGQPPASVSPGCPGIIRAAVGPGFSYEHSAEHLPYFCCPGQPCAYHPHASTLLQRLQRFSSLTLCGFSTCLAGQGRWTLVSCRAVCFLLLPPIDAAVCSQPRCTPRPRKLLLSLPTWGCGDKASQRRPVPAVGFQSKGCLVWSTSADKLMLKKSHQRL